MAYIYAITNKINGKQYVGQTTYSIEKRFQEHKKQSKRGDRKHYPLYLAFRKYGVENFIISELEKCTAEDLDSREIFWIEKLDTYKHGYNATTGGSGRHLYDKEEIIQTLYNTKNVKQTAKRIGCNETTVRDVMRSNNIYIDFPTKPKKVLQIDKNTGQILQSFDSYRQAALHLTETGKTKDWKNTQAHISLVCRGKRKTCGGFVWKNKCD